MSQHRSKWGEGESPTVSITISRDTKALIAEEARLAGKSQSEWCRDIIELWIDAMLDDKIEKIGEQMDKARTAANSAIIYLADVKQLMDELNIDEFRED